MAQAKRAAGHRRWSGGKLTGRMPALKMEEACSARTRPEPGGAMRGRALINRAINSWLRAAQLLVWHTGLGRTARCPGAGAGDVPEISTGTCP